MVALKKIQNGGGYCGRWFCKVALLTLVPGVQTRKGRPHAHLLVPALWAVAMQIRSHDHVLVDLAGPRGRWLLLPPLTDGGEGESCGG